MTHSLEEMGDYAETHDDGTFDVRKFPKRMVEAGHVPHEWHASVGEGSEGCYADDPDTAIRGVIEKRERELNPDMHADREEAYNDEMRRRREFDALMQKKKKKKKKSRRLPSFPPSSFDEDEDEDDVEF